MSDTIVGPDGKPRCRWCAAAPEFLDYHDKEWGFPVGDDFKLFEKLSLEGFQSGLSWRTILAKRENFRQAFLGFDYNKLARFTAKDVERLLQDEGIVRHRGKIESVLNNAQRAVELVKKEGSLAGFVWRHAPTPAKAAAAPAASTSAESIALSKALKNRGGSLSGRRPLMPSCRPWDLSMTMCRVAWSAARSSEPGRTFSSRAEGHEGCRRSMHLKATLRPGIRYEHRFVVTPDKTVPALYPEAAEFLVMPEVFATGFMVGFLEWACIKAINPHLDWPAEQTVGTHIDVSHSAATPPGMQVTASVELLSVEGRKLVFAVRAHDGVDVVSEGTHERHIIHKERFDERVQAKKSRT